MAADQSASDSRFDPRFDPAFQPGFSTADSGAESGAQAGIAAEAAAGYGAQAGAHDEDSRADGSREEAAITSPPLTSPDIAPIPLTGNPWVRVLWVVAILFSLGGIAAMAWSQTAQLDRESAVAALIVPVVVAGVAPWFVLTGLAAGVGVAILAAVRWRPSR